MLHSEYARSVCNIQIVGCTCEFRLVWLTSCLSQVLFLPSLHCFLPSFVLLSTSCYLNIFMHYNAVNFLTPLARSVCMILDYSIWSPCQLLDSQARALLILYFAFLRTLNLLRIWPNICTESWDTSITTNWYVADISVTWEQVAAFC